MLWSFLLNAWTSVFYCGLVLFAVGWGWKERSNGLSWLFLFFKVAFVHNLLPRNRAAILIVIDKQWWEGRKCEWWYISCASSALREKKKKSYDCSLKLSMLYLMERWGCKKKGTSLCTEQSKYAACRLETCFLPSNWKVFGICSLVTWGWGHGFSDLCQLAVVKSETPVPMDYWILNRSQHPFNMSQSAGFFACPSSLLWILWDFI